MDKLEHFAGLLVDLEIAKDVLPILLDNGFDEWEQMVELEKNPKLLDQIGIVDAEVQSKILAAISVAEEYVPSEAEVKENQQREKELKKQKQEEEKQNEENQQQQLFIDKQKQKLIQMEGNTKIKCIAYKDLLSLGKNKNIINNQNPYEQKQREQQITQELTIISLNDKKFSNMHLIEKCKNLQNLHLLGNCFFYMDQTFLQLSKLKILQLSENYISKIENLQNCQQLKKLYLNGNYISRLEGLQCCPMLEEIQLNNQNSGQDFTFCEETTMALGHSLSNLSIENSNIKHIPEYFSNMQGIQILKLRNNQLSNYEEFIEPFKNFPYLSDLHLKGNPLTKVPKYRDKFVLISKSLQNLDEKKILPNERQFLFQLWRKKNGMLEQPKTTERKPKSGLEQVSGQQVKIVYTDEQEYRDPKSYQKLNSNIDFHGNTAQVSSKHVPNSKYYG